MGGAGLAHRRSASGAGVALREFELNPGFGTADYLLCADGKACGVIEAKEQGATLTGVQAQFARCAQGLPSALPAWRRPLPFVYAFYRGGTIAWITRSTVNEPFVDATEQSVTDEALRQTNLTLYPTGRLLAATYVEGKSRGKRSELRIAAPTNPALQADPAVRSCWKNWARAMARWR